MTMRNPHHDGPRGLLRAPHLDDTRQPRADPCLTAALGRRVPRPGAGSTGCTCAHTRRRAALRAGRDRPHRDGHGETCGGGPRSRCATRSRDTGSCSTAPPGCRWLTAAGVRRPRRARQHRLQPGQLRRAAGLGPGRGDLPDLPGPVRPVRRRRWPRAAPDWAVPCDWDTPGHRSRPGDAVPVLRRRPGRHRRAPRPHRVGSGRTPSTSPRSSRPAPTTVRRGQLRHAWIRCSAATRRCTGSPARPHTAGPAAARRHHHQPQRRRSPVVHRAAPTIRTRRSVRCSTSTAMDGDMRRGTASRRLPKLNWGSAELRRRFATRRRYCRRLAPLAAPSVRAGRLAGRRGEHDRPARRRRLHP